MKIEKTFVSGEKRVALYMRVSTGPQAVSDLSIPDQRKAMTAHCASRGWLVVDEFVDARSGTTDNRPEHQRMMDLIKSGGAKFDVVLVHSFSRFFRDAAEFQLALRAMRRRKVNLISITQEIEDTPTGQMIRSIIAIFDQDTSEEISKHVKRTLRENAAQGFHCGGVTPFGYRAVFAERRGGREKKKLEVHPEDATVVRLIFDLYRSGGGNSGVMGVKRVTEWLNDHGHRTRSGKLWSIRQIHDMLTDPV
ncbi:recombinase family protein [Cereibacter sphaeroides]|uniref:recombinase family protein n=1 Tax=Cereibacter sphaeroides TaxID=1063 RepID=UPI0039907FBB